MKIEAIKSRIKPLAWPPKTLMDSAGYSATAEPSRGVITWNINTTCNYRCSYCTQKFLDNRARWAKDSELFLAAFKRLPGEWEVKLSGGEPFQHPTLLEIIEGLRNCGHFVSVVTNFSASEKKLLAFLSSVQDKLLVFSASLHLEYVKSDKELNEFIQKALLIQNNLPAQGSFNATCVATRENFPKLQELVKLFTDNNLRLKVQPEKFQGDIIDYTDEEKQELVQLGGHNGLGKVAWSFLGRPCWAGRYSFTLDDLGNAWRCYPARRFRAQYLGNFLSPSFQLATGPSPCLYSYCNCTVPIERGMMPKDNFLEVTHEN